MRSKCLTFTLIILFVLLFNSVVTYSQETVLFRDVFTDNRNNWWTEETEEMTFKVEHGVYLMYNNTDGIYKTSEQKVNIDESKDFSIETIIYKVGGRDDNSFGIIFGSDLDYYHKFGISGDGSFLYAKYDDDGWDYLLNWTDSDYINLSNRANQLKVEKKGGKFHFYINNHEVGSYSASSFYGNYVGIGVCSKIELEIDEIVVKQGGGLDIVLRDDFNDNSNDWAYREDENARIEVLSGKYYLYNWSEVDYWRTRKTLEIDQDRDFEITAKFSKVGGSDNNSYDIIWGSDGDNFYTFGVSGDGNYIFSKLIDDQWSHVINWTKSDYINNYNATNILKVSKTGNRYYFYVNGNYVNSAQFERFYGAKIGFGVNPGIRVEIDYVEVRGYSGVVNQPPVITINNPALSNNYATVYGSEVIIEGKADDDGEWGVFDVMVNGEAAEVDYDGQFRAKVNLNYGDNEITVTATDWDFESSEKTFTVNMKSDKPYLSTIVFQDDFSNNSNNWLEQSNSDVKLYVSNGKYVVDNQPDGDFRVTQRSINIGEDQDFIIETTLRMTRGAETTAFGLIWGSDGGSNYYHFAINGSGSYIIIKMVYGEWEDMIDWTSSSAVKTYDSGGWNKLTVSKKGNKISFYINDQWVNEYSYEEFFGNRMGYRISSEMKVEIDDIKVYGSSTDNEPPLITLIEPETMRGFLVVKGNKVNVRGTANDDSGIMEVLVNGYKASLGYNGEFQAEITLAPNDSILFIKATDNNYNSSQQNFVMKVEEAGPVYEITARNGKDYALLFAGDEYLEWGNLVNPVFDAEAIAQELEYSYGFQAEVIKNPTQEDIFSALRRYAERTYNEEDQVLVFFAGHGYFDDVFGEGFVVANDSKKDDPGRISYISHNRLRTIIDNIPCEHVFLIMDVCFGGTFDPLIASADRGEDFGEITKVEFIQRKMRFTTRRFLTSGGKVYVSDGIPGRHSPFARKLLEALRNYGGKDGILTMGEIYNYIERISPEPRSGEFGKNEPGSDFIFIAR